MRVLVGCEHSGIVRNAFLAKGHDAYSCDLLPSDGPHFQCDVRDIVGNNWDLFIVHPDCTYLTSAGLHWNDRGRGHEKTNEALAFVKLLFEVPIPRVAIENPIGAISRIRKPTQIIQPYDFGHDASKATGLWLKGLPLLQPTKYIRPRWVNGKPRWANQTDSGQNCEPETGFGVYTRWQMRAMTYKGIAEAMAEQWNGPISNEPDIVELRRLLNETG